MNYIDLFAGAGGLSEGFMNAYLKGEIKRPELYKHIPAKLLDSVINLPIGPEFNETIFSLISKQLNGEEVDLIIGGPPCQAYSLVGRARSADGMKSDPRNHPYHSVEFNPHFISFIRLILSKDKH